MLKFRKRVSSLAIFTFLFGGRPHSERRHYNILVVVNIPNGATTTYTWDVSQLRDPIAKVGSRRCASMNISLWRLILERSRSFLGIGNIGILRELRCRSPRRLKSSHSTGYSCCSRGSCQPTRVPYHEEHEAVGTTTAKGWQKGDTGWVNEPVS
jgi:hypothetical protein